MGILACAQDFLPYQRRRNPPFFQGPQRQLVVEPSEYSFIQFHRNHFRNARARYTYRLPFPSSPFLSVLPLDAIHLQVRSVHPF